MELKSIYRSNLTAFKLTSELKGGAQQNKETGSTQNSSSNSTNINSVLTRREEFFKIASSKSNTTNLTSEYNNLNTLININHFAKEGIDDVSKILDPIINDIQNKNFDNVYYELPTVVNSLKEVADRTTPEGISPLSGNDFIVTEVPPQTLRFPGDVQKAFGLDRTPPPNEYDLGYLQTQLNVFKDETELVLTRLYENITATDVALQNQQAAKTTLSELDSTLLALANNTHTAILNRPEEALTATPTNSNQVKTDLLIE
jgi:hypothetical protein